MKRTLTFLPYFVIGYYLSEKEYKKLLAKISTYVAYIALILAFFLIYYCMDKYNISYKNLWFGGGLSYKKLINGNIIYGGGYQIIIYIYSIIISTLFLKIVPINKNKILGFISKNTLSIYLGHTFFYCLIKSIS